MNSNLQYSSIDQLMEELDAGNLGPRIALALADAALGVAACDDKKKKGKVTIEFSIYRVGGDQGQVQIDHTVKAATPTQRGKRVEESTTSSVMYVGVRGKLTALPNTNRDMFTKNEESAV